MYQQIEVQSMKVKHAQIVKAIREKLDRELAEKAKSINIEKETEFIISTDLPCDAYKHLARLYPTAKDIFEKNLKDRINEIKPSYRTSVGWSERELLDNRVTEFALNNPTFTFDEVYNFCKQGLDQVVNKNELVTVK